MPPPRSDSPSSIAVCLISLGCSKNTVDSEHILAHLAKNGIAIAEDPKDANVCLVNTCGFIQEARLETAETLRRLSTLRKKHPLRAVIALGCMVERSRQSREMAKFLADADAVVSFAEYHNLPEICRRVVAGGHPCTDRKDSLQPIASRAHRPPAAFLDFLKTPRVRIGATHTAYVKISEGCSNHCRFCSIPLIRGRQVSRPMSDILAETKQLIASGAQEINLIAQDTTSYGKDLGMSDGLTALLDALVHQNDQIWYRLLYGHPAHLSTNLLRTIAHTSCICPYLDLPLQHISDRMLRAMGRGMTRDQTLSLIDNIKNIMPDAALRTTFIVGFPGESDQDFAELEDFVAQGFFTHMGVFIYSPEPGTPAVKRRDDVPAEVKEERRARLMATQKAIRSRQLRKLVGRFIEVMVDQVTNRSPILSAPARTWAVARSRFDAPEVDGLVFLTGKRQPCAQGDRLCVQITGSLNYDLVAGPVAARSSSKSATHHSL